MSTSKATPHYPMIDALRAMAALLVVCYHVVTLSQWHLPTNWNLLRIFNIGWIGVDCFLVISGFVITLSALRDYERQPADYRRGFARRRLLRIAPLYVLTSVLFVLMVQPAVLMDKPGHQLGQLLSHLLFIHNLFPSTAGAINGPNWSIALEMQFYVLVLLLTPWLARVSIPKLLLTMIGVAWLYRYGVTLILLPSTAAHVQFIYTTQLPGTLDEFAVGMALALAVVKGHGWRTQVLTPTWRNFTAWTVLALVVSTAAWKTFWPHSNYWYFSSMVVFWRTLLAAAFACWLAAAVTLPIAHSRVFQPIRYLGQISYGIYLWHMLVLLTLLELPTLRFTALLWNVLVGTVLLAAFSWHLFERPLMQRFSRVHRTPMPLAAA